ncbi:MAG: hypothetical protein ACRDJP_02700, partial [Actinomycetota bacterium]
SRRADLTSEEMGSIHPANCSTGVSCTLSDTTIGASTIDNATRHYDVRIYADSLESIEIYRVVIHYTTSSPGPASG